MAKELRNEVEIELDGKTFTLVPSFSALMEFESKADMGLLGISMAVSGGDIRAKWIVAGIYAGLLETPEKMDYKDVEALVWRVGIAKCVQPFTVFVVNMLKGNSEKKQEVAP